MTRLMKLISILILVTSSLAGCTTSRQEYTSYYPQKVKLPSCDNVDRITQKPSDIEDCKKEAMSGDVPAMEKLGKLYEGRYPWRSDKRNKEEALYWLLKARKNGSSDAVYRLYMIHRLGKLVPKNRRIADSYIIEGAEKGYAWAINANIGRKALAGDATAIDSLIKQAVSGNCHAQSELVYFYKTGKISWNDKTNYKVKTNLSKSYFWSLIASSAGYQEGWHGMTGMKTPCTGRHYNYETKKQLSEKLIVKIEDAASQWSPGTPEPDISAPKKKTSLKKKEQFAKLPINKREPEKKREPDKIIFPNIGELDLIVDKNNNPSNWKWLPASLPKKNNIGNKPHSLEELFRTTNKHVWKVFAAKSINHLKRGTGISQGSAVAISENQMLTNCHVIQGSSIIAVKHGDKFDLAKVISGDSVKDQCILEVSRQTLAPVKAIRPYSTLKVGESVFTVGSPSGLENTLGKGIISGLRNRKGQRLIQTTSQISPGSSGGGLFDENGSLIGITTFMLKDTQALNFAIAVEEFGG